MQTDQLRYFIDIVDLGSIAAAAEKNYMTSQGISRAMTSLERSLGCKLLERHRNKVVLTRAGASITEAIRALLSQEDQMMADLHALSERQDANAALALVGFCSPIVFDTSFIAPLLSSAERVFRNVKSLQRPTPQVVDELIAYHKNGAQDVAYAGIVDFMEPFPEQNKTLVDKLQSAGLEYRPFIQTYEFALVAANSPLAREKMLTRSQMRSLPLAVSSQGDMEQAIEHIFGADSIGVSTADSSFRIDMCRHGEAIAFVPGLSLITGSPHGTVAVPFRDSYIIEIGTVNAPDLLELPALVNLQDKLTAYYGSQQAEGLVRVVTDTQSSIVSR